MDVIRGNPTLFMRRDEVEAAWAWVEPILRRWAVTAERPKRYPAGTSGPTAAATLLERDGRTWQESDRMSTTNALHPVLADVTARITERSAATRAAYLARIRAAADAGPARGRLGCANLAHGFAAAEPSEKVALRGRPKPNLAIVTSYNDMLSAHQPYGDYPPVLKRAAVRAGGIAQVAGGVPGDVRRHHPGPRRHAALALQPRRDRDVDRDRALPRHVRRRADARRLRQDRARPADRRAVVRPPADRLRAGRADGLGPAEQREGARCASCTPRARSGATSCSRPRRRRTTRAARARSTAPPTPTSC